MLELHLLNSAGRKVKTIYEGILEPGSHKLRCQMKDRWGNTLPQGVYYVILRAGENTIFKKKFVFLK